MNRFGCIHCYKAFCIHPLLDSSTMHGFCNSGHGCHRPLSRSELVIQGRDTLCCCCRTQDGGDSHLEAEGLFEDLRDVRTYRFQLNLSPYAEDDFECVEEVSMVRLTCFTPKHVASPTEVDLICKLRCLLLAHEAALAQHKLELSTPLVVLTQTFAALLDLVREMQGIRVHIVYFGENDMGGARSLRAGVEAFSKQDQVLSTEATETQEWPHKLQAYESCLASLAALKLDAVGLAATFKPLLKTLSNRASVIEHSMQPQDPGPLEIAAAAGPALMLPDGRYRNDRMDLVELPEDLRRLKNQIAHLVIASNCIKTLPSWLNEFHLLETLELHHGNYFECPLTELPTFGIDQSPSSESHPPQTGILAEHNWGGSKSTHQSASTRVSCAAKIAAGTGIYNHAASQKHGSRSHGCLSRVPVVYQAVDFVYRSVSKQRLVQTFAGLDLRTQKSQEFPSWRRYYFRFSFRIYIDSTTNLAALFLYTSSRMHFSTELRFFPHWNGSLCSRAYR